MAVATATEKAMRKAKDVLDFVNKNSGKTKQFLKEEKLYQPEKLSALERDINSALDELFNSPIKIRVSDRGLDGILTDGRMKTQFETGTSGGAIMPLMRTGLELDNFGYNVKETAPKDRPIYGYVGKGDARQYGNNKIVIRKNNKPRTTVTNDDSMDGSILFGGTATPISWGNNSLDYLGSPDAFDEYLMRNGRDDTKWHIEEILNNLKNKKGANSETDPYIEAQIHGGVTPNDFAGIVVGNPETQLKTRKHAADQFGFELRTIDPRDGKVKCFYNCKEPTQDKQELLDLIERGDFWRK